MSATAQVSAEAVAAVLFRAGITLEPEEAKELAAVASPFLLSLEDLWHVDVNHLEPVLIFVPGRR